ncbi:MAG: glycosyltransferase [Terricaulis sp.]
MGADGGDANLRNIAGAPDARTLEDACEGFHRRFPKLSAKKVLSWPQLAVLVVLGAALGWAIIQHPMLTWRIAGLAAFVLFAASILWRLFAAASLEPLPRKLFTPKPGEAWPIYTVLCPLHGEANVVFDLVAALKRIDYPSDAVDFVLLVEADDPDTIAAALAAAGGNVDVVIVPVALPRTKPKALNVGLQRARGEYLVVYDAEDRPHPAQLRAAVAAFRAGDDDLACLQAPLVIDNAGASWISSQFAAEYAIQFREILPLLARLKLPLPLGGTSNHFRVDRLRALHGWDPYNVTEDADLGYRLARAGWRADVIAPPTWEEAPITLGAWLKQRVRWIKGHMQTWLILMRDPFGAAREMGPRAFASMHLVLGGGVAAALLHGPLAITILIAAIAPFNLLGLAGFILALFGYSVAVLGALTASALSGDLRHTRASLTMPLYWPLATIAGLWALWQLITRPHFWAKTKHGVSQRARLPSFARVAPQRNADAQQVA